MARARWTMTALLVGAGPVAVADLTPAWAGPQGTAGAPPRPASRWASRGIATVAATAVLAGVVAVSAPRLLDTGERLVTTSGPGAEGTLPPDVAATATEPVPAAYHLVVEGQGWTGENPANGFDAAFSTDDVQVTAHGTEATLGLELAGVGRAGEVRAPAPAALHVDGARIEYRRGSITEWYVNDQRGLEQGFTLDGRPPGSGPVVVELAPTGGFAPVLDPSGDVVRFVGGGTTFGYGGLHAYDATGDAAPAALGVTDGKVTLTVDDTGAAYPLTIDPIITAQEDRVRWVAPVDGERFGAAVAVWGDNAVIGQPGRNGGNGAFWSYDRAGASWSFGGGVQGQAPETGAAVAVTGATPGEPDLLAVGVPGGVGATGFVGLYAWSGDGWDALVQPELIGELEGERFGTSVALSGDTLVVGAPNRTTEAGLSAGRVYVFRRSGPTWVREAVLEASDPDHDEEYGSAVAVSGDTIVVGTHRDAVGSGLDTGSFDVYVRNGSTWLLQAGPVTAPDTKPGDGLGWDVAIDGDAIVVGAPGPLNGHGGRAYVYRRAGTTWSVEDTLTFPGSRFLGRAVDISGDTVVVGDPEARGVGEAHIFTRVGAEWGHRSELVAADTDDPFGDEFGASVAVQGDTVVVGAPRDDVPGAVDGGSVYLYRVSPVAPTVTIEQGENQQDPDDDGPVVFDVTFSEDVSGFAADDVHVAGTATGPRSVLVQRVDSGFRNYRVEVSGIDSDGTVIASIPAGAAFDATGVPSAASSSQDNSVRRDTLAPTVTVEETPGQGDPATAATIHFTVTFSEDVSLHTPSPGDPSRVVLTSTAGPVTSTLQPATPGNRQVYDLAVTGMDRAGTVRASLEANAGFDDAGHGSAPSTSLDDVISWTPANPAPVVTVDAVSGTEGALIQLDGAVADLDPDTVTTWTVTPFLVDDPGATCTIADPSAVDTTVRCNDDGAWILTLTADDGVNPEDADSAVLDVHNVRPVLGPITAPSAPTPVGVEVEVSASVADEGSNDLPSLLCTVDWGDGSAPSTGTVSAGTCTARHAYAARGAYSVEMALDDRDGNGPATGTVEVAVGNATQTITFTPPASLTYGDPTFDLSTVATATSNLPVAFSAPPGSACTISGSTLTIVGTGSCEITASQAGDDDWDPAPSITDAVQVLRAGLTVTAGDQSMTYGGTPPALTPEYRGFVYGEGTEVLTTPATCSGGSPTTPVGFHMFELRCEGATATNYTISHQASDLVVLPAPLTITASSGTMTYGGPPLTIVPEYAGFVNGEGPSVLTTAPTCTGAVSINPVGTYESRCRDAVAPNYLITSVAGTVTVTPAPLTITASDASMTYGGTTPTVTPSYDGFVNGQTPFHLAATPTCGADASPTTPAGEHAGATSCSGAMSGNYAISYVPGTLTVDRADLVVTASDATMPFGSAGAVVTPSYDGFVNGEDASVLTTAPTCGGGSSTTPVGVHPGATTCTGAEAANYSIAYEEGTLTVIERVLVITASDATMTYGGAAPVVTPGYRGFQDGDDESVLTTPPTCGGGSATTPVGVHPGATRCSGAVAPGYTIDYVDGELSVTRAPLTITASDESMTYGDDAPAVTPSYAGFVNDEDASVLTAGPTCAGGSPTTPVGSHPGAATCSGAAAANYAIAYAAGTLTVTPAELRITAGDATRTYGGAAPAVEPAYDGFVNGEDESVLTTPPTCVAGGSATTAPGTYLGATSCSGAAAANYAVGYVNGSLTITPAPLTITASPASMTYGAAGAVASSSYTGFVNGEGASVLTAAPTCGGGSPTTPVGSYAAATSCSGAEAANYEIGYVDGALTVTPAPLTIAASDASMTYGDDAPTVTPSYAGFVNGEGASVLTAAPTCGGGSPTTPVGSYAGATSCSGAEAANYEIGYIAGALTVTPAPLTITASDASMTYGDDPPTVTPSYEGFVNGEDERVLTTAPACAGGSPTTPAGVHATSCAGAAAANYGITYEAGTLTVAEATLLVTADDQTKAYLQPVGALTSTVSGFVNGEGPAVLSGSPALSTPATATSDVGTYPIVVTSGTLAAANYRFAFADGRLTVTRSATALHADPAIAKLVPFGLDLGFVSARLTAGSTPVAGETVTFTAGTTRLCTATTAADGTARCAITLVGILAVVLNLGFTSTFAGTPNLAAATGSAGLIGP